MKNKIAKQVKKLREEADISMRAFARQSGLSVSYLSKLEEGYYKSLSLKTSKALSQGLGLALGDFLEKIGYLETNQKRPSHLIIKNAFRSEGYSNADVEEIMKYAKYIRDQREG